MMDPGAAEIKYKNVFHAGFTIVREEGLSALYKGVVPTVLRQASNQAVNFTFYQVSVLLSFPRMNKREREREREREKERDREKEIDR